MTIKVKYFASLREQANKCDEEITEDYGNALKLYKALKEKYHFSLSEDEIKVAINGEYKEFSTKLIDKDVVTFIPPVAGG